MPAVKNARKTRFASASLASLPIADDDEARTLEYMSAAKRNAPAAYRAWVADVQDTSARLASGSTPPIAEADDPRERASLEREFIAELTALAIEMKRVDPAGFRALYRRMVRHLKEVKRRHGA